MDIISQLEATRSSHIEALVKAIGSAEPVDVESALRSSDGALLAFGELRLPARMNFVARGAEPIYSVQACLSDVLSFKPSRTGVDGVRFDVAPFTWDRVTVEVDMAAEVVAPAIREWFLKWFDPEDLKVMDERGLRGVVHSVSGPSQMAGGSRFVLDLGSAPFVCFFSLFSHLSNVGVRTAKVG